MGVAIGIGIFIQPRQAFLSGALCRPAPDQVTTGKSETSDKSDSTCMHACVVQELAHQGKDLSSFVLNDFPMSVRCFLWFSFVSKWFSYVFVVFLCFFCVLRFHGIALIFLCCSSELTCFELFIERLLSRVAFLCLSMIWYAVVIC